jgi:hypothetical protein
MSEPCPGCGAQFEPVAEPPAHPYIGASSACWATFGEVLAREFGDIAYGKVHRHSVDVYAAQHPGTDGRRERQSVDLHLISLAHWLEDGIVVPKLNRITQRLASSGRTWPWLAPPVPGSYRMTVVDVLKATSGEEHVGLVRAWAESVWEAWAHHHPEVRRWAGEALRRQR